MWIQLRVECAKVSRNRPPIYAAAYNTITKCKKNWRKMKSNCCAAITIVFMKFHWAYLDFSTQSRLCKKYRRRCLLFFSLFERMSRQLTRVVYLNFFLMPIAKHFHLYNFFVFHLRRLNATITHFFLYENCKHTTKCVECRAMKIIKWKKYTQIFISFSLFTFTSSNNSLLLLLVAGWVLILEGTFNKLLMFCRRS